MSNLEDGFHGICFSRQDGGSGGFEIKFDINPGNFPSYIFSWIVSRVRVDEDLGCEFRDSEWNELLQKERKKRGKKATAEKKKNSSLIPSRSKITGSFFRVMFKEESDYTVNGDVPNYEFSYSSNIIGIFSSEAAAKSAIVENLRACSVVFKDIEAYAGPIVDIQCNGVRSVSVEGYEDGDDVEHGEFGGGFKFTWFVHELKIDTDYGLQSAHGMYLPPGIELEKNHDFDRSVYEELKKDGLLSSSFFDF